MYHFYRNKEYIFKDKCRVVCGRLSIPTLGGVSEEVQNIHQTTEDLRAAPGCSVSRQSRHRGDPSHLLPRLWLSKTCMAIITVGSSEAPGGQR